MRRQVRLEAMARQRRNRMVTLASITGVLILGGAALALVANTGGKPKASASPRPTPTLAPSAAPIACGAKLPAAAGTTKPGFDKPENQKLNPKKTYLWRLETSCGRIDIKLAVQKSPKTSNSIVFLTRKNFFDGLTFHRIVPDFVIQGGDPTGSGSGGAGYSVVEAPAKSLKYTKGVVAMAKTQAEAAGTSGSQFFIVTGAGAASLPAEYAYAGDVVAGMDVAEKIGSLSQGGQPPAEKVFIEKATIVEQ